jgi:hypothetical protein
MGLGLLIAAINLRPSGEKLLRLAIYIQSNRFDWRSTNKICLLTALTISRKFVTL